MSFRTLARAIGAIMKRRAIRFLSIVLGAPLSLVASMALASSVTYDFTGTVTSDTGDGRIPLGLVGSAVTGTFTFNYAPATQITGNFLTPNWSYTAEGGPAFSAPEPSGLVFSSVVNVATTFNYFTQSPSLSPNFSYSTVGGSESGGFTSGGFTGQEQSQQLASSEVYWSGLSLYGSYPEGTPFSTTTGLPILLSDPNNYGFVTFLSSAGSEDAQLLFSITSLTEMLPPPPPAPVPLPSAAWMILSGLGGLGAITRKRAVQI